MDRNQKKRASLKQRHQRVRRKIAGTPERPRLCVYRSLKHIYAQLVDDLSGRTLVQASSRAPDVKGEQAYGGNAKAAAAVGKLLAERAAEKSIARAVFDRGGRKYHGRVKALADAAREGGLTF
jgi:large subunit ribosomal protein L18